MQNQQHWQQVYSNNDAHCVSWYQECAHLSLALISKLEADKSAAIIDIGGGASNLVDGLLAREYNNVSVLDIANAAIRVAQSRLATDSHRVTWLEQDINQLTLDDSSVDLWHDRAVFHFLTNNKQRQSYLANTVKVIKPGGHLIIATFAEDGPKRCSGLVVKRHSKAELSDFFSPYFNCLGGQTEVHLTPTGKEQNFIYCWFQKK